MRFTKQTIEALQLPAGKSEHIVWDDGLPGFGVRVRATSKAWRIQYRVGRLQRSESLGDIRKVVLEDARRIARQRFAMVELGRDPSAERDSARRAQAEAELTLGATIGRYLASKQEILRPSTVRLQMFLDNVGGVGTEALARLGLSLSGFRVVLQSSLLDGVAFDPFSFQEDGPVSAEVDVGGRQVL